MIGMRTYRGQPLVVLMLIIGGWIAVRMMVFDSALASKPPEAVVAGGPARSMSTPAPAKSDPERQVAGAAFAAANNPQGALPAAPPLRVASPSLSIVAPPANTFAARPTIQSMPVRAPLSPVVSSAGHQVLYLSAMAQLPLPPVIFVPPAAGGQPGAIAPAAPLPVIAGRWSADGWLLLRGGRAGVAGGAPVASYGASQAGAVLRYRLAPGSRHRPDAYVRLSSAIDRRDREVSAGIATRPLAGVPIVVAAEARLTDQRGGRRVRPAAFAYTELPQQDLPLGLRGEAYAQAGYVGGRFSTAFVDAQGRVDRTIARIGGADLRAGAGAWGGAQKGASRVDIGPTASVGIALGRSAVARIDVDWRLRVAGNAAPASGPSLTLSAGF